MSKLEWEYNRCLKLGYAIIEQAIKDYCKAYRDLDLGELKVLKDFFLSEWVSIYSADTQNGTSIIEKMNDSLEKLYLPIDERKKLLEEAKKFKKKRYIIDTEFGCVSKVDLTIFSYVDRKKLKYCKKNYIDMQDIIRILKHRNIKYKVEQV